MQSWTFIYLSQTQKSGHGFSDDSTFVCVVFRAVESESLGEVFGEVGSELPDTSAVSRTR